MSRPNVLWLMTDAEDNNPRTNHYFDEQAFTGEPLPERLQVIYEAAGPMVNAGVAQHLACFNWSNKPKRISVSLEEAGITAAQTLTDFWTDAPVPLAGDFLCVDLPARASMLITVKGTSPC